MFRMASPWGYGPHRDDDEYSAFPFEAYGNPAGQIRASMPFEDIFEMPRTYARPAQPSSRVPFAALAYPACQRAVPRNPNHIPATAAVDPYSGAHHPYGMSYARRTGGPALPMYAHPLAGGYLHPEAIYGPYAEANGDAEDEDRFYSRRRGQAQQNQRQKGPTAAAAAAAMRGGAATASDGGGAADSDADTDSSADGTASAVPASRQQQQQQPMWYFDPVTGLCFRAAAPQSNGSGGSKQKAAAAAATSSKGASGSKATAAKAVAAFPAAATSAPASPPRALTAPQAGTEPTSADMGPRQQPQQPRQPHPSSAPPPTSGSGSGSGSAAGGPTRIPVRMAEALKDPKAATATATATTTGPSTPTLERQGSSAIVPRPAMEVTLSRGPSAMEVTLSRGPSANLPSATATATAAAAAAAAAVPVGGAGAPPASISRGGPKRVQAVAAPDARKTPSMTRSQAARTIQRWWRGWRLWRHGTELRNLVAVAGELRDAAARYYSYMGATASNITHKQLLEINELAMRVILKLDSMEGLPPEFRALRKHLTSRALRLQDEVHHSYAASSARPDFTRAASAAAPTATIPTAAPTAAPTADPTAVPAADPAATAQNMGNSSKAPEAADVGSATTSSSEPPLPPPPPPPPSQSASAEKLGTEGAAAATHGGTAGAKPQEAPPTRNQKHRRVRRFRRRMQRTLQGLAAPLGYPRSGAEAGWAASAVEAMLLPSSSKKQEDEQEKQKPVILRVTIGQPCELDSSGRCTRCICAGGPGKKLEDAEVQAD